jgi:peptidoglycan/LPS O-acetylase OafA/YrhL
MVIRHLLLFDPHPERGFDFALNAGLWTMQVEWQISMLLPFIILVARRSSLAALALAFTLVGAAVAELTLLGKCNLVSLRYAPYFVFGVLLAKHRVQVVAFIQSLSGAARVATWLLCLLLVYTRALLPADTNKLLLSLLFGLGATLLMAFVIGSPRVQRLLDCRPLAWAGRVSFSLYLINLPILMSVPHLLPDSMPPLLQLALTIGVSFAAAELLYRLVELPSIAWGKQAAGWIEHRRARAAATGEQRPASVGATG